MSITTSPITSIATEATTATITTRSGTIIEPFHWTPDSPHSLLHRSSVVIAPRSIEEYGGLLLEYIIRKLEVQEFEQAVVSVFGENADRLSACFDGDNDLK